MARSIYPPTGSIKSIQRGVFVITSPATSATTTVSSVNTAKALLTSLGQDTTGTNAHFASLVLTNGTTITATRAEANVGVQTRVSWQLVEYY